MKRILILSAVTLAIAGCQTDPQPMNSPIVSSAPGVPSDIADLVDARAAGGETQLMARGYTLARTAGLTAYWWNAGSGTCAAVVTGQGRYQSIRSVSASECGASTTAAVVGVPTDIADLVGARGSSGEMQLMARGYTLARTAGLTAYWWNAGTGVCAQVVTGDGRYQSVDAASRNDCGR